ncbi:MAG: sugar phosphate isomerase/epimerase [Halieaceae bacterium]|nr:sugar phosphate isomerase/epimerase [Halieaceae bacterium]
MHITGIGINGDSGHLGGSLVQLQDDLTFFQHCGYDAVELSIHGLDVLAHGQLRQSQVDKVRVIVESFDFIYTVHAPDPLNLAFSQHGASGVDLEQDIFLACLDFCAAIDAEILVYHSGLNALRRTAFALEPLPDEAALAQAREREVSALRTLMPLAAERGVVVAMENDTPHLWEVATLLRAGLSAGQLSHYHAGLLIPTLVQQIESVGHPNLGLTLDFAHLYVAANACGFDYLEAVRQAAPYVRHLHGNDNFGRLGGLYDGLPERIPYGDGDLHLPPGWGTLPHVEALAQLPDYEGLYVLELRPRFYDHFSEALETMRRIVGTAIGEHSPS